MNELQIIDPRILNLLQKYGVKKTIKAHDVLVRPGEKNQQVFYVLSGGFLRRFYNDKSDLYRTISFHLPLHRPFFTINETLFADKVSSHEIKSFQTSDILLFNKEVIEKVSEQEPILQEFSQRRIIKTLIYENDIKARIISYSSKELYEYLCDEHPEIVKHVPSKYIAEFMSISPEWLSKLRSKG